MPIEITEKHDDSDFDSFLIIGNNLETDLGNHKLQNYLNELQNVKKVKINMLLNVFVQITTKFFIIFIKNHEKFEKDITFLVSSEKKRIVRFSN